MSYVRIALVASLFCFCLAGCGPGTYGPFPPGGRIALSPSSLSFTAIGAASAQTIAVNQPNYGGGFIAATTTCNGIASISQSSSTSFTVTPLSPGHCTFSIAGSDKQSATLTIDVTTTTVGGV